MEGSKLLLFKGASPVRHTAGMWRFFVFPFVTSVAAIAETALFLYTFDFLAVCIVHTLFKSPPPSSSLLSDFLQAVSWGNSHIIGPHCLHVMGAGLLLGLGMAGYELVLYRQQRGETNRRGIWLLLPNIFWFGFYFFLLTAPLICALIFKSLQSPTFSQAANRIVEIGFSWIGLLVVFLAWVYFLNSGQVFSPKTIVRRIRLGRFNASQI